MYYRPDSAADTRIIIVIHSKYFRLIDNRKILYAMRVLTSMTGGAAAERGDMVVLTVFSIDDLLESETILYSYIILRVRCISCSWQGYKVVLYTVFSW